jgi:hypothetical protein
MGKSSTQTTMLGAADGTSRKSLIGPDNSLFARKKSLFRREQEMAFRLLKTQRNFWSTDRQKRLFPANSLLKSLLAGISCGQSREHGLAVAAASLLAPTRGIAGP